MAIRFVNIFLLLVSLLPLIHSLSTVAISETGNQTLVCALSHSVDYSQASYSSLNCTVFPQRMQMRLDHPFDSISGIVGGAGFLCALTSFRSSSESVLICWRFSTIGYYYMNYTRVYLGPVLRDLDSGNSHICGLVNGSNSVQCWQWRYFEPTTSVISSNLEVGEDFICGLSDSGQVQCIGNNISITDRVPAGNFSLVRAGFSQACAVSSIGSLSCWGDMTGQVPNGEFTSLALGDDRGCAIRPNGTVVCWGQNGLFGLPESLKDEPFISIEAKRTVFCGVTTSNYSLICWGNEYFDSNPFGLFGDVVPGPCRPSNECACGPLPNYGEYCSQGLMICQQTCIQQPSPENLTPPPPPPPSPPMMAPPPPTPSLSSSGKKWTRKMVAFMVLGCIGSFLFLSVLCIFVLSRYFKVRGSRIHDSGRLDEESPTHSSGENAQQTQPAPRVLEKKLSHLISMGNGGGNLEEYSLETLLEATDNFSDEIKIGTGSFGSVYRATLSDGREVAVKRAENSASPSYQGTTKRGLEDKDTAFLNELEFLSRLNHKNLVRLLGYCEDSEERVLVYEYMANGTLHNHLHKLETSPLTSWPERIKVALDAARGIEYLHEYAMPRIIHRDIKSSNILLDANGTAKVSDFGLSLMGPQDDESHLSLKAAGTMGYMDPEYYRLQMLTTKSDVYSFGIVLLELLSGFKAIHKNEDGVPRNVVDYVVPYIIHDEVHRVLDKRVPPPTPFEYEAVAYVGYLAADCVMPEGRDRPTMTEVVSSLDRAIEACLAIPVLSRSSSTDSQRSL